MNALQTIYASLIEDLVAASHLLSQKELTSSVGGNLCRRAGENHVLVTPTGVPKSDVRTGDICIVDLAGDPVYEPDGRRATSETPFHTMTLRERPDIIAVAHAHPPVLSAFSISETRWMERPFFPEPAMEVGPVIMVPYAEPSCGKLALVLKEYIGRSNGFLLQNHGALALSGQSAMDAVEKMYMMESTAKSVFLALQMGGVKTLTLPEVAALENLQQQRGFGGGALPITRSFLFE